MSSYSYVARDWHEIHSFYRELAAASPGFQGLADIVTTVMEGDRAGALSATTSMHDLIVVETPVPEPPFGVIAVRAPGSLRPPLDGHVLIEHLSVTGYAEAVERPLSGAVPLFWRFVIEKFGVQPPDRKIAISQAK
ncbi:hypothetical protein [Frankia sp. AgB1.8]|uniref:hypothetical protein n=1 Tax=Frankia sp. AgB1.8 TaxID=2792839 RepID=UPI0019316851|nr:hypothetical protein [Frankia sp. AgB1.8]